MFGICCCDPAKLRVCFSMLGGLVNGEKKSDGLCGNITLPVFSSQQFFCYELQEYPAASKQLQRECWGIGVTAQPCRLSPEALPLDASYPLVYHFETS